MFYMMFWVSELLEIWSKISAQIVHKRLEFYPSYKKNFAKIHFLNSLLKNPLNNFVKQGGRGGYCSFDMGTPREACL